MARERSRIHPGASQPRRDRATPDAGGDPYASSGKLPDPSVCTSCGAMVRDGRWIWGSPPADAHRTRCPACRRIEDRIPAGVVTAQGAFLEAHRAEIVGLARHLEEREKGQHPLVRIMDVTDREDGAVEITVTDARLARTIGRSLKSAYAGDLETVGGGSDTLLRVTWQRD